MRGTFEIDLFKDDIWNRNTQRDNLKIEKKLCYIDDKFSLCQFRMEKRDRNYR